MNQQRGYKVRSYSNGTTKSGREYRNYSLTVPSEIAEALPEGVTFIAQMTDEGLLYIPTKETQEVKELPAWARPHQNSSESEPQEAA